MYYFSLSLEILNTFKLDALKNYWQSPIHFSNLMSLSSTIKTAPAIFLPVLLPSAKYVQAVFVVIRISRTRFQLQTSNITLSTALEQTPSILLLPARNLLDIMAQSSPFLLTMENSQCGIHKLCDLLTAGCLSIELPSNQTISHNINTSFEKCCEHITKLL